MLVTIEIFRHQLFKASSKNISDELMRTWFSQLHRENTFEFVMQGFEFSEELNMYFPGKLVGQASIMLNPFEKICFNFVEVFRGTRG